LDVPILKGLAIDMLSVMANWFHDPKVICCLIQAIWSTYAISAFKNKQNTFSLVDTKFGDYLDTLISFLDLIIILLSNDIRKFVFFIPDFIKEITSGVMGAILLVMQETLFALRDSVINTILNWINSGIDNGNVWAKCLPFKQFLDVIKKYISDYGFIANIMEKIKGWVAGLQLKWGTHAKIVPNVNDLEFLYWLRDLLIKLKNALINFDLCVDYSFSSPDGITVTGGNNTGGKLSITTNPINAGKPDPSKIDLAFNQGYTIGADGSLILDKSKIQDVPLLANSFVRQFISSNYPDIPLEAIDAQITGSTSADHIQGTNINTPGNLSDLNADCPFTPNKADFLRWVARIRS